MPPDDSESPDESFFNDLSRSVPDSTTNGTRQEGGQNVTDSTANKPKRIACVLCRKRKLRCDGARPTCGTCKRLSHDCAYDEVRKKSGPKRGYVKLLEARLQQVETLLKSQEFSQKDATLADPSAAYVASTLQQAMPKASDKHALSFPGLSPGQDGLQPSGTASQTADGGTSWEMIGLGLDEPLPPQDVQNDLYQIYFTKIHPSAPIVHKPRFFAAMNLAPHMRPPVCLRYSMWTLAASVSDKYNALQGHFYQRARKHAQNDEMKGHGEATISVAHCQAWLTICTYEFKEMYFPRAWLSVGRGVRMAQMMQLHRMDGIGLDVKQCLPPPKDWTEREERRRTFWLAFCVDRYASIGTGWPMTIDERDILTNLPSSEEAFEKSRPMHTVSLEKALQPGGAADLEPFGGIAVTAALFGRNLLHLHRPNHDDRDNDLNGGFWRRHREIENVLLGTLLALPDKLRLPLGLPDPNVVFLNMSIHTSAICLHQAAIFKADKYRLPVTVSNESKGRCVTAATEIASLMRMISHMDLSSMNPFISFCVYVAARVFVQCLKTRPKDQQMHSSLQFLLQAMQALRRRNPLTDSFLVQLDVDLEAAGIMSSKDWRFTSSAQVNESQRMQHLSDSLDSLKRTYERCPSIYDVSESQAAAASTNNLPNSNAEANPTAQKPTQKISQTPGPPFHRANVAINLDPQPVNPFGSSQTGTHSNMPSHDRTSNADSYASTVFTVSDENEMDISTDADRSSPATTTSQLQSRNSGSGGPMGHTSHLPAYQNEMQNLQFRDSPKNMNNNQIPAQQLTSPAPSANAAANVTASATASASNNAAFFSAGEDLFDAIMYSSGPSMSSGTNFLIGNEWDLGVLGTEMGGAGAEMTPMSDRGWNQVLESMTMGWGGMGPPHGGQQ